jgi:hypothetical protein
MAKIYQSDQRSHLPEAEEDRSTWLPDRANKGSVRLVPAKT